MSSSRSISSWETGGVRPVDEVKKNLYAELGLSPEADVQAVRQAFLHKARSLIEAYEILTDPPRREQYDLALGFLRQVPTQKSQVPQKPLGPHSGAENFSPNSTEVKRLLNELVVTLDGRVSQPATKINRRLMSRLAVEKQIFLSQKNAGVVAAKLLDVSGNGAKIFTRQNLHLDETISVSISETEPAFALATVVRMAGKNEYGLKWIQVFEVHLPKGFLSDDTV